MTKAYSYVRMSTDIQIRGDSKRRQYQLSRDYAARHGLDLVEHIDGSRLEDLGVSGYRGLNADSGALSVFIEAMKQGKIEKGSYLLIESLDRLSRETTTVALNRFMEIIAGGIVIVTLFDGTIYSSESLEKNPHMLLISIVGMMRANEESETKSKRLAAAWENKRRLIHKKNLTSICPAWLFYDDKLGEFKIDKSKAEVVKSIFEMCATTMGASGIVKHLNKNKIPVFGRAKSWGRSYVLKIIHNRSVLADC